VTVQLFQNSAGEVGSNGISKAGTLNPKVPIFPLSNQLLDPSY